MGVQLFDIILKEFQSIEKSFNRIVTAGLLFILFGHFYVVEPYFQYKREERGITKELREKEHHITESEKQLSQLETTQKNIILVLKDIKNRIRLFPDQLRGMLPEIQRSLSSGSPDQGIQEITPNTSQGEGPFQQIPPSVQQQFKPSLNFPPEVKTFEQGVRWYINNQFSQIIKELRERVIEPALRIETATEADLKERLSSLSDNAIKEITKYVDTVDPDFWRSYSGGKVPVARGLYEVVDKSIQPIYKEINPLMDTINTTIRQQKEGLSKVKDVIKEIQSRESILESRLISLESPIGKLPVGLTDFIKLFPLLMVILIVIMTTYLHKSRRLCDYLQKECDKTPGDAEGKVLGYLTNLWYFKTYKDLISPLLLLILFVITGLFIRSFFLVVGNKELFVSIMGKEDVMVRFIFISAYLIGIVMIVGCIWFMQKRWIHKDTTP